MSDSDSVMQYTVITLFSLAGVFGVAQCIRAYLRNRNPMMKQSPSMEDLTSISTDDPQS